MYIFKHLLCKIKKMILFPSTLIILPKKLILNRDKAPYLPFQQ